MILGFSHLTYATADASAVIEHWLAQGWTAVWTANAIPSPPEKWPLMRHPAARHDLHMLAGPIKIEVIAHDTGAAVEPPRLTLASTGDIVEIAARNPAAEAEFLCSALRFTQETGGNLTFRGRLPGWSVSVRMVAASQAPIDPPLDVEGFSCLAFLSTAPEDDARAMRALGARDITDSFRLAVNGRSLQVLMLRSPEGTLIELVKVETKP